MVPLVPAVVSALRKPIVTVDVRSAERPKGAVDEAPDVPGVEGHKPSWALMKEGIKITYPNGDPQAEIAAAKRGMRGRRRAWSKWLRSLKEIP